MEVLSHFYSELASVGDTRVGDFCRVAATMQLAPRHGCRLVSTAEVFAKQILQA